ncbi:hypothetical protein QLX08_010517 [Tetragonisca angustula]
MQANWCVIVRRTHCQRKVALYIENRFVSQRSKIKDQSEEQRLSMDETRRTWYSGTRDARYLENGGHVDSLNLGVMLACTPGPSGHHNLFE